MTRLLSLMLCATLALGLAVSQSAPRTPPAPASQAAIQTVTMRPGQTARLGKTMLTLLRVQDDRCPPHAYCIMAGKVTASVLISQSGKPVLVKPGLLGRAVNLPAGTLKLAHVSRREVGKQPRLTFELTGGQSPR